MHISVIIPTLNEEKTLGRLLSALQPYPGLEIIVADGGSVDGTLAIAEYYGTAGITSEPGRGKQQNAGAGAARGDIFLFLHSDTFPPADFPGQISSILDLPGTAAGAFRLGIDAPGFGYRVIEWGANRRSGLLQLSYGDQGLFVSRRHFFAAGGFPDQPILEDIELVRRLRKFGRIRLAPAAVSTSPRRWRRLGIFRTFLINQLMLAGHIARVSPDKLAKLYYGKTGS